jgi:D-alanyl-D-alanine carboxypeptidase
VRRWAALLAAGALAGCGGGGEGPAGGPPAPEAPRAQRAAPPPPPLSPGTAVSPLAVDLAAARDPVALRFKRPPAAGLLFDLDTGQVLWRRDPRRARPMASLTKMMTALVVVDRVGRGGSAKVTPNALNYAGSGVGLLPKNRWVRVEVLLHGLLLVSGNDAARVLAERAGGGSIRKFVRLMNARARRMGLTCTRFTSPDGLDRGNRSCPADLAAMARAVLREPRLAPIVAKKRVAMPFPGKGGRLEMWSTNPLLRAGYRGATGVKTGYTVAAGRCLVASARRGRVRLGVVLLHSRDPGRQARQLLDRGFRMVR